MPSRQTKISQHFRRSSSAASSQHTPPTGGRKARRNREATYSPPHTPRLFGRPDDSDSEGSEGLANITFSTERPATAVAHHRVVLSDGESDDEDPARPGPSGTTPDNESDFAGVSDDDDEVEVIESVNTLKGDRPARAAASPSTPRPARQQQGHGRLALVPDTASDEEVVAMVTPAKSRRSADRGSPSHAAGDTAVAAEAADMDILADAMIPTSEPGLSPPAAAAVPVQHSPVSSRPAVRALDRLAPASAVRRPSRSPTPVVLVPTLSQEQRQAYRDLSSSSSRPPRAADGGAALDKGARAKQVTVSASRPGKGKVTAKTATRGMPNGKKTADDDVLSVSDCDDAPVRRSRRQPALRTAAAASQRTSDRSTPSVVISTPKGRRAAQQKNLSPVAEAPAMADGHMEVVDSAAIYDDDPSSPTNKPRAQRKAAEAERRRDAAAADSTSGLGLGPASDADEPVSKRPRVTKAGKTRPPAYSDDEDSDVVHVGSSARTPPPTKRPASGGKSTGKLKARATRDPDEADAVAAVSTSEDSLAEELRSSPSGKNKGKGKAADLGDGDIRASDRKGMGKAGKLKRGVRDPDADDSDASEADGGSDEQSDLVGEVELDESHRFKTKSRLRVRGKETAFQRKLRLLREKRSGVARADYASDDDAATDSDEDEDASSDGTSSEGRVRLDPDSFIVDDDDDAGPVALPAQFSLAQTPEYKFKVVFQYLLMLVIRGPDVLPLRGENAEYFLPHLHDLRERMTGLRNSRVRSQIWKAEFVKALETFPDFERSELLEMEPYCDACNRRNQHCYDHVRLSGSPYDRDSHETKDSGTSSSDDDSDDSASDESSDSDADQRKRKKKTKSKGKKPEKKKKKKKNKLPRSFNFGSHCCQRAHAFHTISHWEDELFYRIQSYYHDLLRATNKPVPDDSDASTDSEEATDGDETGEERADRRRERTAARRRTRTRVARLRAAGRLPKHVKDLDEVTQWMDDQGYQIREFKWFEDIERDSRKLEFDHMKDK